MICFMMLLHKFLTVNTRSQAVLKMYSYGMEVSNQKFGLFLEASKKK